MKQVTVIIPAYNEEERIARTIQAVKTINGIARIVVVNDGSNDRTSIIARKEDVLVIDLDNNLGKGGAMNASLPLIDTDVVAFLDADLGDSASQAETIIQAVIDGEADLCIASFPPPSKKAGFGLVKGTAAWAIRKMGNIEVTAPLSGQRAMTREVLKAVTPFQEAYGVELGMSLKALQMGYRILEIPTTMKHNESGRDLKGFLHRGQQFIDVIKVIYKVTRGKGLWNFRL